MHIRSREMQALAEELKTVLLQSIEDNKALEETLAEVAKVNQSTVSRWIDSSSDIQIPAFAVIAWWHDPRTMAIAEDLIAFIERETDREGFPVRPAKLTNGSTDDELLAMAKHLGAMVKDADNIKLRGDMKAVRDLRRNITEARTILQELEAELNLIEKHGKAD